MRILIWVAAIIAALSIIVSLILYISAVRTARQQGQGASQELNVGE